MNPFLYVPCPTAALSAIYNAHREMPDANMCAAVCMARSLCGSFSQTTGTLRALLGGGSSARRNTDLLPVYVSMWGLELQVQNSCHSQALKKLLHLWIIDRGKLSMPVRLKGILLLAGGVMLSLACCWRGDATFPIHSYFYLPLHVRWLYSWCRDKDNKKHSLCFYLQHCNRPVLL